MYERKKRPYQYRERPYDYRENLIREESRNRKNRKQLAFSETEYSIIKDRMAMYGTDNFSEYVRNCLYNNNVTKDKLNTFITNEEVNTQRKQICFNDDEIAMIDNAMRELKINNFNLYIKLIII